jgi:hypothetical protein
MQTLVCLERRLQVREVQTVVSPALMDSETLSKLRHQYSCGPVEFAGTENGLYEPHRRRSRGWY